MRFVLDASVALLWLAPGTHPAGVAYAEATLMTLKNAQAVVPSLWALEVVNVLAKLEAKAVVTEADLQSYLALLAFPMMTTQIDDEQDVRKTRYLLISW